MWHVWGRWEVATWLLWRNLRERDHLQDPGVGGGNNIKMICKKCDGETWTRHLAEARDRWRALVNAVMNLRYP
jgi:hypothetical protein